MDSLPKEIQNILEKFIKEGYQIYIVGGAVRDILMGRPVKDWDFTTDAKPEEILTLFPQGFYDNKFGTVGIPVHGSQSVNSQRKQTISSGPTNLPVGKAGQLIIFEITTMRKEGIYIDFRHPEKVEWTNKIEEDLARRDFTINAMALGLESSVNPPAGGQGSRKKVHIILNTNNFILIDPFSGQDDLKSKLIKAVGNSDQRFKEDALRLIRAIRLAAELEFDIEKNTFESIKRNAHLIKEVSNERIRDELFKMLVSANPYMGIIKLREAGILQIILPELEKTFGVVQKGPKHIRIYDIGEHSLSTLKHTPSKDPITLLAALLHDIGKPQTFKVDENGNVTFYHHEVVGGELVKEIANRFRLSKKQTDKLFRLVRWHLFTVDERQTDAAIRRFVKNIGVENIDDMMALRVGDRLGGGTQRAVSWRMEKFRERIKEVLKKPFTVADLKVSGHDVMEILNIPPGPYVGEVLNKLFTEVLENASKNNREYLLERIKSLK